MQDIAIGVNYTVIVVINVLCVLNWLNCWWIWRNLLSVKRLISAGASDVVLHHERLQSLKYIARPACYLRVVFYSWRYLLS